MTRPLEDRVRDFILEHHLVSGGETLLVAVSGGPDSVCLLHILAALRDALGIRLAVGHLNHGLRGQDAEADADYVLELSRKLGIPATLEQRSVAAYRAEHRISLEEAAREVRYTFLAEVAHLTEAARVAVGHTSDDNIETILLHLIRGTGSRGLRGLLPCNRWQLAGRRITVVRPLLTASRDETVAYCQQNDLSPRLDVSNLSLSHLRNRIRHQLLPLLKGYNPGVGKALLRTAAIISDDLAFTGEAGDRAWADVAEEQQGTVILKRTPFLKLHPALKRHILRTALDRLIGNLRNVEMRHIEELMAVLTGPAGRQICLPGGLIFTVEYDRYLLGPEPEKLSPYPPLGGEFDLRVPGETTIPGWRVEASILGREAAIWPEDGFTAYFDFGKTGDCLTVRPRQPGDRFQPLGMGQPKKLAEFMIDARIPQSWRGRIPVVCSPGQIIWLVGWRIDDRARVTGNTGSILRLSFRRSDGD